MEDETIVHVNGVDICVATFGDPDDPAILLIGGAGRSMDWWEDEFCSRLAAGLRFVIRYDSCDTRRSVSYQPGPPPYTVRDLAADALGLLDAFALPCAHLVGISMGGAVVQRLAVEHPDRVASLILIDSGDPVSPRLGQVSAPTLVIHAAEQALPDPPRRQAIVNVGRLVAAGGTLIVIAAVYDERDSAAGAPPWPLSRTEIDAFATDGLTPIRIEQLPDPRRPSEQRWRAEFNRPQ